MNGSVALKNGDQKTIRPISFNTPPHALTDSPSSYSIVLNLLGTDQRQIGIHVNEKKREISVLARKDSPFYKRGFYWVFGVPRKGQLSSVSARFRLGVLEIVVPKQALIAAC